MLICSGWQCHQLAGLWRVSTAADEESHEKFTGNILCWKHVLMLISLRVKASGVEMVPLQHGIVAITVTFVNTSPNAWKGKSSFQRVAAINLLCVNLFYEEQHCKTYRSENEALMKSMGKFLSYIFTHIPSRKKRVGGDFFNTLPVRHNHKTNHWQEDWS